MKSLTVPFVPASVDEASQISSVLDVRGVGWTPVDCNNWAVSYPYAPCAQFRIAHTNDSFLIEYTAKDETVRARNANDNGDVWTDSCMEFFLSPQLGDGTYYNLECNCIGTVLLGVRGENVMKSHAGSEVLGGIKRWSSLGHVPFEEFAINQPWHVALTVPFSSFWHHDIGTMLAEGHNRLRANFYKCGDALKKPHFLSWAPIKNDTPNFHLPEFFGEIVLAPEHNADKQ